MNKKIIAVINEIKAFIINCFLDFIPLILFVFMYHIFRKPIVSAEVYTNELLAFSFLTSLNCLRDFLSNLKHLKLKAPIAYLLIANTFASLYFYIALIFRYNIFDRLDQIYYISYISWFLAFSTLILGIILQINKVLSKKLNINETYLKIKLNKIIIIIVLIVTYFITHQILLYFSAFGFIDYPTEILDYEIDGKSYHSHIEDIKIVKKEHTLGKKILYLEIYLIDEKCKRTDYIFLYHKYIGNGIWFLEDWHHYKEEEIQLIDGSQES